jgi:hypothetical protein
MLAVAKMMVHLGVETTLYDLLLELGKQAQLAPKRFGALVVLQKLINKLFLSPLCHRIPFLSKRLTTLWPFTQFISHPLMATDFEPMPGQTAMSIYLTGKNDNEDFYYRLVMQGTTQTGYTVSGFYRGSTAYPASKLRQTLRN